MDQHTAKHFALQVGSLASLYLSVIFFLVLLFGLVTLWLPDAADSSWQIQSAENSIRIGFAMVIVFFPTYLVLTRIVNHNRRSQADANYLSLTKWLIYLSLLVGGGVLLGDLVAVVYAFLEGDITIRFILKALAVFVVTGLAFFYYLQDARGYWLEREPQSLSYAIGTTVVVTTILVVALFFVETPAEVREQRIDANQIEDLQNIQWEIEAHLLQAGELPDSLETVYGDRPTPTAPAERPDYRYERTEAGFNLCATFSADASDPWQARPVVPTAEQKGIINPHDWNYQAGEWCFARVVNQNT